MSINEFSSTTDASFAFPLWFVVFSGAIYLANTLLAARDIAKATDLKYQLATQDANPDEQPSDPNYYVYVAALHLFGPLLGTLGLICNNDPDGALNNMFKPIGNFLYDLWLGVGLDSLPGEAYWRAVTLTVGASIVTGAICLALAALLVYTGLRCQLRFRGARTSL